MVIKSKEYYEFTKLLCDDVLSKLLGSHDNLKRYKEFDLPSSTIFVGNLTGKPEIKNENKIENDELEEEKDEDFKSVSTLNLANSLSVKFLIQEFKDQLSIDLNLNVYYKVYPTYQEQLKFIEDDNPDRDEFELVPIWKRQNVKFNNIKLSNFNKEENLDFSSVYESIKNSSEIFTAIKNIPKENLESEEKFNSFIKNLRESKEYSNPCWDCKLTFNSRNFIQNNTQFNLIEISLINESEAGDEKDFEVNIFNPLLKIKLNQNEISKFEYEYSYEDSFKTYGSFLRCLNCHGDYTEDNEIITKNYSIFEQNKLNPINNLHGIDISFEKLSTEEGIEELEKIYSKMLEFLENCENNSLIHDEEYINELNNFKYSENRFKEGIELLKNENNVLKAFCLMNKTFNEYTCKKDYHNWRLFQIVFITSLLKDLTEPNFNKETCDLLHVKTGGGKSEAYFAIVIFSAFFDRLNGKKFGVTAITKFPLRMLSIQQLQRIADIFIFAENIRKNEIDNIDDDHFSISYFVGSQDDEFPSSNRAILDEIEKRKEDNKEPLPGKIINKCPICDSNVYLDIDEERQVIVHKCSNEDCANISRLYYCDDEVYRTLPTLIVATVDKFAGLSTNRRFKNLLGGKIDSCKKGHGFFPHNDKCTFQLSDGKKCGQEGELIKTDFNTGPSLVIQDEMHLIRESFGTIDSHFESLAETLYNEFSGLKFKNICMTATITGANNQIKELYNKDTCIFPPKLKDNNGNTFFFKYENEDESPVIQRRIIGLKSNTLKLRLIFFILRYISEFIKNVENNIQEYTNENFNEENLNIILDDYKKLLTYHNKKEDVQSIPYYINAFVNDHETTYDILAEALTGESSLQDIKNIINQIEDFDTHNEQLLLTDATNIVSHGVDIKDWNIMIFDGMTRNTAEYIQALSRVGRKNCGIVFVSFRRGRTRDLSFYQNFDEYHNILEHKVEKVPLTRWAKLGYKQTFTSIFCASILNYMANLLEKPIYNNEQFIKTFEDEENVNKLIEFINKVYLVHTHAQGSEYFLEKIPQDTKNRISAINTYMGDQTNFFPNALKDNDKKYYNTQFGMRGIQDEIILKNLKVDNNFLKNLRG